MHSRYSDNFAEQINEPQMHFLAPLRTVEQRKESVPVRERGPHVSVSGLVGNHFQGQGV